MQIFKMIFHAPLLLRIARKCFFCKTKVKLSYLIVALERTVSNKGIIKIEPSGLEKNFFNLLFHLPVSITIVEKAARGSTYPLEMSVTFIDACINVFLKLSYCISFFDIFNGSV